MPELSNVNLLFYRRARGVAALSRFGAGPGGTLVVAVPDEMEARTVHVAGFDAQGRTHIRETYSVETLRRTEVAQAGGHVGITDDDLYLFRDGRKTRLLSDRRASFCDIALAEDGQRFVTAFSDLIASGYALAFGDTSGRLLWTRDLSFAAARVAINRAGNLLAVAGETGDLLVFDSARTVRTRFRYEQTQNEGQIIGAEFTALAVSDTGDAVFGAANGIGKVEADGHLLWFTDLGGVVVEVACERVGQCIAALVRTGELSGRLVFLNGDGLPVWDVDYEDARPTGISLSADGRHAAVSLRDGTLNAYELEYGERLASLDGSQVLLEAQTACDDGNFAQASIILRTRLQAVPTDAGVCAALNDLLTLWREQTVRLAQTAQTVHDFVEAEQRWAVYLEADPNNRYAWDAKQAIRQQGAEWAKAMGLAALQEGRAEEAETRLLEAVHADPLDTPTRDALAAAREVGAQVALRRGRDHLQRGEWPEALRAFADAQTRGANGSEVSALVREARVGESLALGNALYRDRQYPAALFQFKKVLRLDPENRDAQQKAGYAQRFLQDTQIAERFNRLE